MRKNVYALMLLLLSLSMLAAAQDKSKKEKLQIDDDQTYLVLSTKRIGTMEKELDEAAAKGFRVLYSAPTQQWDMAIFLKRVQEAGSTPYGYKILATVRRKTMEKELNETARQGFRLLPRTITYKQGFLTAELLMIMEREPKSNKSYEYKLVTGSKETKLHKKIDEAIAEGFSPVTMIIAGDHIIVMERETVARQ